MFSIKYKPNNIDNFIGNKNILQPFIKWLLDWNPNTKNEKCALISGLNGIGKSLFVELILKKHDYNIIYLSIDEDRNKDYIKEYIKPILSFKKNINEQENILVVSDIDCIGNDTGFFTSLLECLKETKIPIICICDDRYSQNIKPILNYCLDFKFQKPCFDEVYPLIYKIVITEKIKISKSFIEKLYQESNGDIRFILNNLQLNIRKSDLTKNIQTTNIFDSTAYLLNMDNSINEKNTYFWLENDLHPLMIFENYILHTLNVRDELKKIQNLSYSSDSLSDMDIFDNIFDYDLSSYKAYNTIKATLKCNKKGLIKFPQILSKISTINKNKREKLDYETKNYLDSIYVVNNVVTKSSIKKIKSKK
jgi:replication factor C subunit 1